MKWKKVQIKTSPQNIDLFTSYLLDFGISEVEINDPEEFNVFLIQDKSSWDYVDELLLDIPAKANACIVFYLPDDEQGHDTFLLIEKHFQGLPLSFELENIHVNEVDWIDEWKKYFVPIKVDRVTIVPIWHQDPIIPSPEITFLLDPGSAFGTGQHATTYLCVEALQRLVKPGDILLDAGCGSGILSVIALQLGAEKVIACDIDPSAIASTRHNASINKIKPGKLDVLHGNILNEHTVHDSVCGRTYDIIVANIVADVVIALLPMVMTLLKPGGYFIASGIIHEREQDVLAALQKSILVENREREGWHCLVCTNA